jgi:hypothetical protein
LTTKMMATIGRLGQFSLNQPTSKTKLIQTSLF